MQNTSCFTCLQSLWILLVTFHTFNKLNSQNGTLTADRDSQTAESKPVTDWHPETPAVPLGLSLIILRLFVCLPQTEKKNTLLLLHLFSPPMCCICSLCFLFCAAFFSLSHFQSVFPSAAFLCLPPALYSSPFFSALIDPAAECSAATDVFGWGCWWLNGLRYLPNDCLEQQPQGHKTEWN